MSSEQLLLVTYTKSSIGYAERQKATVRSLGLRRLGDTAIHADLPSVRGMVRAVQHLVSLDVLDQDLLDALEEAASGAAMPAEAAEVPANKKAPKPEAKATGVAEAKPEAKATAVAGAKPEAKANLKTGAQAEPAASKAAAKAPSAAKPAPKKRTTEVSAEAPKPRGKAAASAGDQAADTDTNDVAETPKPRRKAAAKADSV